MKELRQITVVGMGLLGGSITLALSRCFPKAKVIGYSHRPSTRRKARRLAVTTEIVDDIKLGVSGAGLVIVATPISTFEQVFGEIADALPKDCIVTDVGSTKILPHRWAKKILPRHVHYVGSHPIAGSEQRGVEFARDDLFERAGCIITRTKATNSGAVQKLTEFWSALGCSVKLMTPSEHDSIFAKVSHLPHITAAALVNASNDKELKFAGNGFIDTSRIASGPVNIWADILLTNTKNCTKGIDKLIAELTKLKKAINAEDKKQLQKLLEAARTKRNALINYKMKRKELLS